MKKILTNMLILSSVLLAAGCEEKEESATTDLRGIYYASVTGADETLELFPGASKTFDLKALAKGDNVSGEVLKISFKADADKVEAYNDKYNTSYQMCPGSAYEFLSNEVMMPRYGKSSTTARIKVSSSGLDDDVTYVLPISVDKATGSDNWEAADTLSAFITFKKTNIDPSKGTGTADMPYLLSTVDDLKEMAAKLVDNVVVYFKLQNDIDMSGVDDWVPLNPFDPYTFKIDFDGAGHTISNFSCTSPNYPSFFGVLVGKCHDVTFTNATISTDASSSSGILGGYCGTTGLPGEAYGVHVQGTVTSTSSVNGVGGLFGRICEAKIEKCSADAVVHGGGYDVGVLFGYDSGKSEVRNCWTSGESKGGRYVGGIAGMLYTPETAVYNCYSLAKVYGKFQYGGIAGNVNLGDKANNKTNDPKNHIEKCIAWNELITTTTTDSDLHYSSGAIAGYVAVKNYFVDCYRRADLNFTECPANSFNVLYDQANSSPETPLVEVDGQYNFPYHGKAAPEGATLSQVAKSLGWDESIWVLTGNLPYFKGSNVPVEDPDIENGGQLPDFGENPFFN